MMLYLEITGVAVGLLYLWLEYRASIALWPVGIVMPALYIWIYYASGFYADMGINVYYLLAGAYGWAKWRHKRNNNPIVEGDQGRTLPVTHMPGRLWPAAAAVFAVFFVALAAVLKNFTDSTVPWGDSFTTALSIVGLWMLSRKYAEQWLVWLAVDVVCAALYFYKGLYPTGALYAVYSIIAMFGYHKWLKMISNETA